MYFLKLFKLFIYYITMDNDSLKLSNFSLKELLLAQFHERIGPQTSSGKRRSECSRQAPRGEANVYFIINEVNT